MIETWCIISIGFCVTHYRSSKKKLKTKSSTEAELVSANDYLSYNIWYVMFMHQKGYLNKSNNCFQDNQSAMRMEVNRRNYCTGNLSHISIRYFVLRIRSTRRS